MQCLARRVLLGDLLVGARALAEHRPANLYLYRELFRMLRPARRYHPVPGDAETVALRKLEDPALVVDVAFVLEEHVDAAEKVGNQEFSCLAEPPVEIYGAEHRLESV